MNINDDRRQDLDKVEPQTADTTSDPPSSAIELSCNMAYGVAMETGHADTSIAMNGDDDNDNGGKSHKAAPTMLEGLAADTACSSPSNAILLSSNMAYGINDIDTDQRQSLDKMAATDMTCDPPSSDIVLSRNMAYGVAMETGHAVTSTPINAIVLSSNVAYGISDNGIRSDSSMAPPIVQGLAADSSPSDAIKLSNNGISNTPAPVETPDEKLTCTGAMMT